MDVSIIILNYNTFEYTCQCIRSVIDNTHEVTYEIILVDNASVECDADLFKEKFPLIKLIKSDQNLGFSKGCNLGLTYATGSTFLLLNSDVKLLNDAISIAYKNFEYDKNLAVVTVKILLNNGSVQNNCENFPSIWKIIFQKLRIHKLWTKSLRGKTFLGYNFNYDKQVFPDWVHGTFMLIDREKISYNNYQLNDKYFMYGEDLLWCWELRQMGFDILFDPNGQILHYWNGSLNGDLKMVLAKNNDNLRDFLENYTSGLRLLILKFLYKL